MCSSDLIWLAAIAVIFAVWTVLMFKTLFQLGRIAMAKANARGAGWPTFSEQLGTYAAFLTAPEHRKERRWLFVLTIAMFTIIFGRFASGGPL